MSQKNQQRWTLSCLVTLAWKPDCMTLRNKAVTRDEASATVCFSIIFGRMRWYWAESTSVAKWASFPISHCLWLKCQKLRHSATAVTAQITWQLKASKCGCPWHTIVIGVQGQASWEVEKRTVHMTSLNYCTRVSASAPTSHIDWASIKAIPVRAWTGPKGSRRLRLPDFKTIGTWRQ